MRLSVAATEPAAAVRNSLFFGKRNSVTFTLVPFAPITVESKPDSLGACDDGGFCLLNRAIPIRAINLGTAVLLIESCL